MLLLCLPFSVVFEILRQSLRVHRTNHLELLNNRIMSHYNTANNPNWNMARFDIAETIDCWLLFFGVGCYSVSFQSFELFSNCTLP